MFEFWEKKVEIKSLGSLGTKWIDFTDRGACGVTQKKMFMYKLMKHNDIKYYTNNSRTRTSTKMIQCNKNVQSMQTPCQIGFP